MEKQGKIIEAPGLVFTYTRQQGKLEETTTTKVTEAAIRILGALLLLYQQHAPGSSYYEVQHISAS